MKKRLPALLLALTLALTLTACGDSASEPSDSPAPSASADVSAAPEIVADLSKSILEFSVGLSPEDVMVTVNGEGIGADLFCYLLASDCNNFVYQYYSYYGTPPESLGSYADFLRQDAVTVSTYYVILRQKAAELGVPLTDEQRAEADAQLNDEVLEQLKEAYSFSDQSIDFISTLQFYNENVLSTVPEPTDEELNNYVYRVKHILFKTVDDNYEALDDDTVAEKRTQAEDALSQLQSLEGEALTAKFDELMNEYSEDPGLASNPDGYTYTVEDSLVDGFTEAALDLKSGEISGIVETDYGYHIMLRLDVEDISQYSDDFRAYRLDDLMGQWADDAEVTVADAVAAIDVDDFYNKYVAYQNAYAEAHPAEDASAAPEG